MKDTKPTGSHQSVHKRYERSQLSANFCHLEANVLWYLKELQYIWRIKVVPLVCYCDVTTGLNLSIQTFYVHTWGENWWFHVIKWTPHYLTPSYIIVVLHCHFWKNAFTTNEFSHLQKPPALPLVLLVSGSFEFHLLVNTIGVCLGFSLLIELVGILVKTGLTFEI